MRRRILDFLQRWSSALWADPRPLLASVGDPPGSGFGPGVDPALGSPRPSPAALGAGDGSDPPRSQDREDGPVADPADPPDPADPEEPPREGRHRRLAGRVKKGLISVVASSYDARADDLEERAVRAMRKALVEERSHLLEVAREMYDARADDLQARAVGTLRRLFDEEHQRVLAFIQRTYDSRADDLEERAVRAMRSAIQREADRIESLIEHSVHVKRREVRLSLLVLVVANLIYLIVYWVTGSGGAR